MPIKFMSREQIEILKKRYPVGSCICLDHMEGEQGMPDGLKGKVDFVDDAGQIHVNWENCIDTRSRFISQDRGTDKETGRV